MRPTISIDCSNVTSAHEFWQRYIDSVAPDGSNVFGRNLDAFWDALHGGPGWPGDVDLRLVNAQSLASIGDGAFLNELMRIADDLVTSKITFD